ncbi:uncharacterized protein LOC142322831 isoform X2 [Lycorma delicatula]|uniref:uncharacterized protein LOC142322831 isoform X2 n=1 Tax=Lycorma delicatula TaxID=130591 RepID=UPI003F5155B4
MDFDRTGNFFIAKSNKSSETVFSSFFYDDGQNVESDTNYDHVTMDMSEDSSSSVNSKPQIVTDRVSRDPFSGEIGTEEAAGEGDKSSGFSSSDSCCSSRDNDFSSLREKLYKNKQAKSDKSSSESKSHSSDRYYDNKLDSCKKQLHQKSLHTKTSSKDLSGLDSEEADSEEDDMEASKYRDRQGRIKDRDRKRHRSRSRERSHTHDRHRSRSPTTDRHHSSKHYSHRSHHSMSRERDIRGRNRSRSREKSRSSYDSKRQILEKLGIELKVPDGGNMTPQMALQKSMEEQIAKVKNTTGISLPSYYNPIAVNPTKYAEQMQKRKLLWGGAQKQVNIQTGIGKEPSNTGTGSSTGSATGPASLWQGARFSQDQDGKLTAKFKRLMGIKQGSGEGGSVDNGSDLIKKQEEMFNSMEMQYEVARVATHTHRGLGLGFGVHQYPR